MVPRFFLRDDDATAPSAALERLLTTVRRFNVPLLLAVIPQPAEPPLAERMRTEPLVTPCQHGYAHRRHTPEPQKAVELGGPRPVDEVLAELRAGRERMQSLFGDRLSDILVPPWNRIDPAVAARVHEGGYVAVSGFGWKAMGSGLPELNTHVDIIDWSTRAGRDVGWTDAETARRLVEARERGGAPLGILTHHLVHDDEAWQTLDALLGALQRDGVTFERADDLVGL